MSVRNGDKPGFNREQKQVLARWGRTPELLERTAKAFPTGETAVRVQPRVVAP